LGRGLSDLLLLTLKDVSLEEIETIRTHDEQLAMPAITIG